MHIPSIGDADVVKQHVGIPVGIKPCVLYPLDVIGYWIRVFETRGFALVTAMAHVFKATRMQFCLPYVL